MMTLPSLLSFLNFSGERHFSLFTVLSSLPTNQFLPHMLLVILFFKIKCRPVIDPIALIFHRMLCGRSNATSEDHDYSTSGAPLPGSDSAEASRRR